MSKSKYAIQTAVAFLPLGVGAVVASRISLLGFSLSIVWRSRAEQG
jgi:hypothetical protein